MPTSSAYLSLPPQMLSSLHPKHSPCLRIGLLSSSIRSTPFLTADCYLRGKVSKKPDGSQPTEPLALRRHRLETSLFSRNANTDAERPLRATGLFRVNYVNNTQQTSKLRD